MKSHYKILALSYRQWHYRMTPQGWDDFGPAIGLGVFAALNAFSILMLTPAGALPAWLFASLPPICALLFAWHNHRIYASHPATRTYAKFSDAVPGIRQFPAVYGYMFLSFVFFVASLCISVRAAA